MAGENDILTRDENGDLAVRTVSSTESATVVNPDDVYTRDTDGNLCIRTTGSGGGSGDQHNLGWYATQSALETAHPTAEAGDWAIVGSTDTVWIWDTDTNAWKDSDQKGQVASVNGQTGTVVLTASDVGAATAAQGALADTAIQSVKTINGQSIVGTGDVTVGGLPDQTGQSGKFLTTDGTDASWSDKPLVNSATGNVNALAIKGTASGINSVSIGQNSSTSANQTAVAIGSNSKVFKISGVSIGGGSEVRGDMGIAIGANTYVQANYSVAIGLDAAVTATNAIQISAHNYDGGRNVVNSDANTVKIANANGNFEIMSADGTIPEARLADTTNATAGQVLTLDSNLNAVWQAGGSGSSYTAGTGINITNDVISTDNRVFRNTTNDDGLGTSVGIVGTSNYVYQTIIGYNCAAYGNSKQYMTAIGQLSTASRYGISIGNNVKCSGDGTILIGEGIGNTLSASSAIGIGHFRRANMLSYGTIYIGRALYEGASLTAGTFYIGLRNSTNEDGTVYEMLSHNGTIPAARHAALPSADGTYVLKLVIANGVPTLSWVAE